MSDLESSFLQAIARQPHDWQPRLIFADWLEEQGDPRGELIRLSHALTRLECEYRQEKEGRLRALSAAGVVWPSPSLPNSLDMQFMLIPPGQFRMGSSATETDRKTYEHQVEVILSQGFWIGQYEVTQADWEAVMRTTPWKGQECLKEGANYPATHVSWPEASDFCVQLTAVGHRDGWLPQGWRIELPTDAQWEYACRSGTQTRFSFGEDDSQLEHYAWFHDNTWDEMPPHQYPQQVGLKKPNPWGLHDMHGNVYEWCRDSYVPKLPGGTDPEVESASTVSRVIRGGAWDCTARVCRSSFRLRGNPDRRDSTQGFRLALIRCGIC